MLCVIEDVERMLRTVKQNIRIGTTSSDNISEEDVSEYISDAESIMNVYLADRYKQPYVCRLLLGETSIASYHSLTTQPVIPAKLNVVVRGSGDISAGGTVKIEGTDDNDDYITETLTFVSVGAQTTKLYYKTVTAQKITTNATLQSLTDGTIIVLFHDVLSVICARLASYQVYVDIFSQNSPNEVPVQVQNWYDKAMQILEMIKDGSLNVLSQVAPETIPILERPYYNIPFKFFTKRGVAGIEALNDRDTQIDDDEAEYSTISGTAPSVTAATVTIVRKWTSSTRPSTPEEGQIGYNTQTQQYEGWNGTNWIIIG